ncbi:hypothetical protein SPSIL_052520 [Sporomusa silvacetica DSM 10669]|uniref:NYN domain-containing protein n=1 Tax=Sporomusa silvacetica DSM 10669 TaxID=1123289 RepID=A0ABZ3ITI3_9FIRM|nr:NYN domain-containing protein [Sporomusa silvacetica]OZC19657.1 hypothetical protein SPSIL_20870 [Sporomusa silvacetica DSM 10669]
MSDAVAILYDLENSSFEMLNYAVKKAKKYSSDIRVASDWEMEFSKRWNQLFARKDLSFIQVERKITGKNSLDYALFDAAVVLQQEGFKQFIIVTTDADFADIAKLLHNERVSTYILGIGGICCSEKLRASYDKFLYYPTGTAQKVANDNCIPKGEPLDEVRECLFKAYSLAAKGKRWVSMHELGQAFKSLYPEFIFPKDHPLRLRGIIKIYHTSFEWKRNGNILLVKRRENSLA